MADNTDFATGANGAVVRWSTDDVGNSVQVPRTKVQFGPDGSATDVSAAAPLPVTGPLTDAQLRAGAVVVDTELPASVAPTDADANGAVPPLAARGAVWNGTTWERARSAKAATDTSDGTGVGAVGVMVWNGATWERAKASSVAPTTLLAAADRTGALTYNGGTIPFPGRGFALVCNVNSYGVTLGDTLHLSVTRRYGTTLEPGTGWAIRPGQRLDTSVTGPGRVVLTLLVYPGIDPEDMEAPQAATTTLLSAFNGVAPYTGQVTVRSSSTTATWNFDLAVYHLF